MRTLSTTIDVTTTPSLSSSSSAVLAPEHSSLHSPVPYLFGGLAAMLCLIAFALLILAFSYWKISGFLGRNQSSDQTGDVKSSEEKDESIKVYEEKFVVIMAGDEIPTFLATPICIKGSTFEEETSPLSPLSPSPTAATATATECTTDEMVHHQTENRETQDPDQHQTENRETQEEEDPDEHQTH